MRIWHQSITDLSRLPQYRRNLSEHAAKVLSPDTTVVPHGMPVGVYGTRAPTDASQFPYIEFLCERLICEAALAAEREGFDAMAIGCYYDPGLRLARSLVDIPVVGITETSMLIACSLGKKFGVVTICPPIRDHLLDSVDEYGLSERMSSIISMDPPITEYAMEGDEQAARAVEESFLQACRQVIAEGADVIIPGEGVLNEFAFRRGITSCDGAPIIDGNAALWNYATMLANLRRTTGLVVSRRFTYAKPPRELLEESRAFHHLRPLTSEDFS
ncbi:MAG: aspartate/glutamate racemase family protein [Peptococcaceae bacterium]|jgi:Asp/Glu/hydantoin racemase|nr:aspartate/glutamate racemase family protein [Peptococcaceae bacterium]MDH7526280.1 aspartate/glutamate racemase family protein [Peptococcaceae bacterium]